MTLRAIDRWTTRFFFAPPEGTTGGGGDRGAADAGDRGDATDRGDASDTDDADLDAGADDDAGDRGDDADPDADLGEEYLETERMLDALDPESRAKNAKTRLRRYERQLSKLRPFGELLRGPDGQPLPPQMVQRKLALAADMEELEALLEAHPDLRQQILDRHAGKATAKDAGADTFVDPYADESKLWFDTETEAGQKFLAQLRQDARDKWELRQEIKRLKGGFETVARGESTRQEREVEDRWKNTTLAASKQAGFAGELEKAFVKAVYADFRLAKAERRLNKVNAQQIIDSHLKSFRQFAGQGRRAAAADTSRRVAGNGQRPGPQRRGAPTTARDTAKPAGTIKEARKSFFERVRGGGART